MQSGADGSRMAIRPAFRVGLQDAGQGQEAGLYAGLRLCQTDAAGCTAA